MVALQLEALGFLPQMLVHEGKALVLLEAPTWVQDLQLYNVIFESNCKTLVDSFTHNNEDATEYGAIIGQCNQLLLHYSLFSWFLLEDNVML